MKSASGSLLAYRPRLCTDSKVLVMLLYSKATPREITEPLIVPCLRRLQPKLTVFAVVFVSGQPVGRIYSTHLFNAKPWDLLKAGKHVFVWFEALSDTVPDIPLVAE